MNWLFASLVALIGWGFWGVFIKLASNYWGWSQIFVTSSIVTMVTSLAVFVFAKPQINALSPGFVYSLLAGVAGALAVVAFYSAMGAGKAMIVVPLTALYPIVTIILSYLVLSEKITPLQGIGVALALAAILLLSID